MQFDGASFRDPAGRVLQYGTRIFRAVFDQGLENYRAVRTSGVLDEMIERGLILAAEPISPDELDPAIREILPSGRVWLEHPRLDYISYPYEWCFSGLRAAALLHLDLQLNLLERGFTLSDATAYNVQFRGTRPVFIDHLSLVPYEDGSVWIGQRQFGMQFLNPLYLWAKKGIAPNAWYRGSLEGIEPEELLKILGWKDRFSFTVLAHIVGPAAFARRRIAEGLSARPARQAVLPKPRLVALLTTLRDYIANLAAPFAKTVWGDYADNNSYDEARRAAKHAFVGECVAASAARLVYDIGCNSGDFSQTALSAGAQNVIGFDFDHGALERAFARFDKAGQPVLPLWLDAANPSPSQGWAGKERKSMAERGEADFVLALAVIHHLAIAKNVPLDMAVAWLMSLAKNGVIEFPSKADPMVQQLLHHRPDIFPDYTEGAFLKHVSDRGRILRQEHIGEKGRLIIAYERKL
jgi:ribosomal protein L11 methylase PrmA